jgi:hypothetical protein
MEPLTARRTWRTCEPVHGMIYFAPEAQARYAALGMPQGIGLAGRMGYFASRGAAFGPVSADVIIATFFNFHPALVRSAIPQAWRIAAPAEIVVARLAAVDAALRRALGDGVGGPEMREAAGLARRAAEAASEHPQGRPLFAAHAALDWPDEPHLVLWHAQSLLREFRGDGHIAALLTEGLTGVDALVTHGASGGVGWAVLKESRAWPDDEWNDAVERMRSRGLVGPDEDLHLTEAGRAHRQGIEDRTDALSVVAYEPLGEDGCTRLRQLVRPVSRAVVDAGLLPAALVRRFSVDE